MFPCSQQNFPFVPMFPKSIFFDFAVPCSLKCAVVPVFPVFFLLFPCSQKVNDHIPLFPETPGGALIMARKYITCARK